MVLSAKTQAWLGTPRLTSKADLLQLADELGLDDEKRFAFFKRAEAVRLTLNDQDRAELDEVTDSIRYAVTILK